MAKTNNSQFVAFSIVKQSSHTNMLCDVNLLVYDNKVDLHCWLKLVKQDKVLINTTASLRQDKGL